MHRNHLGQVILSLAIFMLFSTSVQSATLYQSDFEGLSQRPSEWKTAGSEANGLWEVRNGSLISGDGDVLGDARSYALLAASGSQSWKDYEISADVWMSQQNGAFGFVGRWQNELNHYEGSIEFNEGQRIARIIKVSGTVPGELPQKEILAQGSVANDGLAIPDMTSGSSSRDSHRLSLSFSGSTIVLSIDGTSLLSANDATIKSGTAGLLNWRNFAYFDNLKVESAEESVAIPVATPVSPPPAVRVTPRFTPAPRPTPQLQAEKLQTITRPVPESILQNMDLAELKQRLTKDEQAAYEQMSETDQLSLLRNIRTRMITSTGTGNAQMTAEIENLKKQLEQLTSTQKEIAENVSKRVLQDQEIADGILAIEALQNTLDHASALSKANELLQKYPGTPLLLDKKRSLERLVAGTYEGYDAELAKNESRYNTLVAQAQAQERDGNLEGAISSWTTIIGMSPSKDEWLTQANSSIGALSNKLTLKRSQQDEAIASIGQNKLIVFALVGISAIVLLVVLVVLVRFHKRARERDEQILTQVKDLTQPLVDMQAEIRQLTGTGMLALPNPEDLEPSMTPAVSAAEQIAIEDGPVVKKSRAEKKAEKKAQQEQRNAPDEGPISSAGIVGLDDIPADDELFNFNPGQEPSNLDLPLSEPASKDELESFAELSFPEATFTSAPSEVDLLDDLRFASAETMAPGSNAFEALAAEEFIKPGEEETIAAAPQSGDSALDISFSDLLSPNESPSAPVLTSDFDNQTVKMDSGLIDLDGDQAFNLDLNSQSSPDLEETVAAAGPTEENAIDLFPEDVSAESEVITTELKPEPIKLVSSALPARSSAASVASVAEKTAVLTPGIVFEQDFEEAQVGERPEYWTGDEKNNVMFHVVESHSRKVLRYFKNAGTDSVHFFCRFPNVGGVVSVEFDVCCPQKNKYLLGLYVERDGNYNQAVRTVIHCIDPSAASIRMQNEPVEYALGDWCHVRYVIDLHQGAIDGYVDGEQVLTQQTFVNKPSSINTLSIRDNHATTGELLIDNIKIEKLA